jgi:hypothetical protein
MEDVQGALVENNVKKTTNDVFVLVCSDSGFQPHQFVAVYDSEELAEKECAKRNDYEHRNYGIRSSWEYSIQKHDLNSVIWKL